MRELLAACGDAQQWQQALVLLLRVAASRLQDVAPRMQSESNSCKRPGFSETLLLESSGPCAACRGSLQHGHQHLRQGSAVAGGTGLVGAAGHVWVAGECGDAERGHGRVPKGREVAEGAGAVHHVARGTRPKQRRVLWHRHERSGARALPLAPGYADVDGAH